MSTRVNADNLLIATMNDPCCLCVLLLDFMMILLFNLGRLVGMQKLVVYNWFFNRMNFHDWLIRSLPATIGLLNQYSNPVDRIPYRPQWSKFSVSTLSQHWPDPNSRDSSADCALLPHFGRLTDKIRAMRTDMRVIQSTPTIARQVSSVSAFRCYHDALKNYIT